MKSFRNSIIIVLALVAAIAGAFLILSLEIKPAVASDPAFLPILISSALVDSVNPCAFSILIITVAFLASLGTARRKVLQIGGVYIIGILAVYFFIGLGLLRVLDIFGVPHVLGKVGAALLLVFGVSLFLSMIFPKFPIKFKIPDSAHSKMAVLIGKASLPAALILGMFVALFEFPCTGGPYLMVLGLLHDKATMLVGAVYLFLYNLIFILPLVAMLLLASEPALMKKAEEIKSRSAGTGKIITATAMIILAFVIFLTN